MLDDTLPVWQKLYQIVSGSNEHVIPDIIDDVLDICEAQSINVLLDFKVYTKESFEEWKKFSKSMLISQDDEMCCFIHRMSRELIMDIDKSQLIELDDAVLKELVPQFGLRLRLKKKINELKEQDLDVNLAWSVICNFLIFDYYGKVDELKSIIRYEANIKSIIDQLWMFYTSDRMFLLKTLRFIFEKLADKDFMYYEQFNSFLKKISLSKLWENLVKSFEHLLAEIDADKSNRVPEETLDKWIQRNNREQSEVLLLMIHVVNLLDLQGNELETILKLFLRHGFGRHPLFFGAGPCLRPKDIVDIKNAEIGVVLALINRYWENSGIFKMIPKELESDLEQYQIHGDNSSVLFCWVVFKCTLSENHLDYCRNVLDALLQKKVFTHLAAFVTSSIYENCKAGEIIIEATNRLFIELTKIVEDGRFIYEQDGFIKNICELYKRPNLRALDNLGVFFEIGLDMFPYMLDNFLDMVEALITSKEHYAKVMKLLHNCPTYCTELPWPYNSDAIMSTEERNLFLGTNKFVIPIRTLTEKCNCFGLDVIKFHYKYDFFKVIEQFIRALTMWAFSRGDYNKFIFNYVLRANKFLSFLIQHYQGNFKEDTVIKPLLQRLDCVPTYYNKSGFRNYDFFCVYFEAKCSLVKYQNVDFHEAFPPMIRKLLFPQITEYRKVIEDLKILQTSNDCILYGFLKEEENLKDHKLLVLYIEIILDVLKKDIMHGEVLFSGVWFVLYVVFSSHKQWNYDEGKPFQQVQILNGCLQIVINVLQQNPAELNTNDQKELYKLVHDSFLNDSFILNNFYNVFVKDKFYLPNLMHKESNWIAGNTLIVLDTVKLELIVLLLIFKCRAKISNVKCQLDERTHVFAKSASRYFITPYNCTLAILAGRFLEILARDENIPLMSCLGLDYDQIQTLFLERLRDPMEDENVKLNILNIISTCIFHQTGMTAAFFNIQSSKKWYNPDIKKIEGDTVGDFMMDYLKNIKKSVSYLKSPLQVGILRVMANLWQCQKQHLIKEVTSSKDFWTLMVDPLFKPFEQAPFVYSNLLKILSIQFTMSLKKPEGQEDFFKALGRFLNDHKQLRLFQQYLFKIFANKNLQARGLKEREMLLYTWTELLVTAENQDTVLCFPNLESKYLYIELAFDGVLIDLVHRNILSTWLDYMLVVIDMFGLDFEPRLNDIAQKVIDFAKIIRMHYTGMHLKNKRVALTIILKVMEELDLYYEKNPGLSDLLEEIGPLVDMEHAILEEQVWDKIRASDPSAKEWLGPWALIIAMANFVLNLESSDNFAVWFANRRYLDKMIECTCELLSYKDSLAAGKVALYSLTLYVQSDLAYDFLKVNMLKFYDRVEPMINALLTGQLTKVNVLDLKEAWVIFNLLLKFNQAFLNKFQRTALETCYAFLTLNEHIIKYIMNLPENTVDFKALDLLTQTIIFYHDILQNWKIDWYRKSNKTFTFMTNGIRKVINSCIYLCLRSKHIGFYYLDDYYRLVAVDQDSKSINDLMISVINRLIGILSLAFSCLYRLNSNLIELFDYFEPDESIIVLIQNDFSVPRFEFPIPCDLTYGKLLCLAHFLCKTLNQLQQNKHKKSSKIDESKYSYYVGLVEHQDPSDYMPDQKLSSFLRYLYEYSGLIDPWINNLNYQNVQRTADMLMLFIAQQAFLTIKILEPHQMPYYKRNLYSELQFFNEYVKKRTSELKVGSPAGYTGDMDYIKRYLLYHWQKNEDGELRIGTLADENFLLIISFWFSNICQLQ